MVDSNQHSFFSSPFSNVVNLREVKKVNVKWFRDQMSMNHSVFFSRLLLTPSSMSLSSFCTIFCSSVAWIGYWIYLLRLLLFCCCCMAQNGHSWMKWAHCAVEREGKIIISWIFRMNCQVDEFSNAVLATVSCWLAWINVVWILWISFGFRMFEFKLIRTKITWCWEMRLRDDTRPATNDGKRGEGMWGMRFKITIFSFSRCTGCCYVCSQRLNLCLLMQKL